MDATTPRDEKKEFLDEALKPLLGELTLGQEIEKGYQLTQVNPGPSLELILTKGAGSFTVWLRNPADDTAFFKKTEKFLIGYRGDPPDRQGYEVIEALVKRIQASEAALPEAAYERLFQTLKD